MVIEVHHFGKCRKWPWADLAWIPWKRPEELIELKMCQLEQLIRGSPSHGFMNWLHKCTELQRKIRETTGGEGILGELSQRLSTNTNTAALDPRSRLSYWSERITEPRCCLVFTCDTPVILVWPFNTPQDQTTSVTNRYYGDKARDTVFDIEVRVRG